MKKKTYSHLIFDTSVIIILITNNILKCTYYNFCCSGAYNLESFLDLGSNTDYSIPNVQPDEGCNIQFTSVSKSGHCGCNYALIIFTFPLHIIVNLKKKLYEPFFLIEYVACVNIPDR